LFTWVGIKFPRILSFEIYFSNEITWPNTFSK
jgi:hypothetical protein